MWNPRGPNGHRYQDPPTPHNGERLPPEDKVSRQPCAWYRTLQLVGKPLSDQVCMAQTLYFVGNQPLLCAFGTSCYKMEGLDSKPPILHKPCPVSLMAQRSKKSISLEKINLAWNFQSRLKFAILTFRIPHRKVGLAWIFDLAWEFQSWRAILRNFFKLWAFRDVGGLEGLNGHSDYFGGVADVQNFLHSRESAGKATLGMFQKFGEHIKSLRIRTCSTTTICNFGASPLDFLNFLKVDFSSFLQVYCAI